MIPAFLLLLALPAAPELVLPLRVAEALDEGRFVGTPAGFRIIALSHIADGCADRASADPDRAAACLRSALRIAERIKPSGLDLDQASHGLWLTHWALIMGAADRVMPCSDARLHARLAQALAAAAVRDPSGLGSSYPGTRERWPADQSATLAALVRFDRAHHTATASVPYARYRRALEGHLDPDSGLPYSELSGRGSGKLPRGCALSYTTRYLAELDPVAARALWDRYKERYLVDAGLLVGFREWPPGHDRPADVDSGPIVRGVGAAATAFAIAAARAMGDQALVARLWATATIVGSAAKLDRSAARASESTLAEAIRFQAGGQAELTAP